MGPLHNNGKAEGSTCSRLPIQSGDRSMEEPVSLNPMWKLLSATYTKWTEDHAQGLGAALAFYAIFSLAPLLLIVIAIAGLVFGQEAAQGQIIGQIQGLVGEESAKAIQTMIEEARKPAAGIIATVLAIVLLFLGATGVFAQLQEALNIIWRVEAKPEQGMWKIFKDRFISLLAVLGTGFLLLISLVISAGVIGDRHDPGAISSGPRILAATHQFLGVICHRDALICHDLQTAP